MTTIVAVRNKGIKSLFSPGWGLVDWRCFPFDPSERSLGVHSQCSLELRLNAIFSANRSLNEFQKSTYLGRDLRAEKDPTVRVY